MTNTKKQPVDQIRDGALKAAIWLNHSPSGSYYSVTVSRTFKQGETFKDSHSFSGTENLRAAELHRKAYDRVVQLRSGQHTKREKDSMH